MPVDYAKTPGLKDLLDNYKSPYKQKKPSTYQPNNILPASAPPTQQPSQQIMQQSQTTLPPTQSQTTLPPTQQQTTLPLINKEQSTQQNQTTAPQINMATSQSAPKDDLFSNPSDRQPEAPQTSIDWSSAKVQGSNMSVNDWFTQYGSTGDNFQEKRKKIQNDAFEDYWDMLIEDTKYFRKYWDKEIVKQAFLQGPDAIAALFFDGSDRGKFGISAGDIRRARSNGEALYKQMRNEMANYAPDESVLAESGATPKIFYDDKGRAIAQGYQLKDGSVYIVKDLRRLAEAMGEAQNVDIPSLTEWMNEQGYSFADIADSSAWQGIQDIITQLMNPENQAEWVSGGLEQAGNILGLGGEAGYNERVGGLADLIGQHKEQLGQEQQLTDEQNRYLMNDIKKTREETKLIIEALGSSGRTAQALIAADEISSQISNIQIQYRMKVAEQNQARLQAQYDAEMQQYQYMVQTGQFNVSDYIQKQRENAAMQLSVYGEEVNMIVQGNAQYLQQYAADLQSMQLHAQQIYNGIMAELGMDESLRQQMQDYYNMALAPYNQQLQNLALMREEWAFNSQQRMEMISAILGMVGSGAEIVASIAGGFDFGGSGITNNTESTPITAGSS